MSRPSRRASLVTAATSTMAVSTLMQYSISGLGPQVIDEFALSGAVFGSFFTFYFAVCALGSFALGGPSQRLGARWGMASVGLAAAAGFLAAAAAPSVSLIYLGLLLSGVAGALSNPATNLALMNVPGRATAIGIKQSGVQVSAVLGGLLVAPLAVVVGWRGALLVCTAAAVLLVGLVLGLRTGAERPSAGRHTGGSAAPVGALATYAFLMGSGLATTIAYLPVYAHDSLGLSAQIGGLLLGVFGVCAVTGRVLWGYVADRSPRFSAPAVALGAMAGGALLAAGALAAADHGPWGLVVAGAVLMGLTGAAWNGLVMSFVIHAAPTGRSGRTVGWVQGAFFTGLCLTPLPFGIVVDRLGSYGSVWLGAALIYIAALIVSQGWMRRPGRASATSAGSGTEPPRNDRCQRR